MSDTQTINEVDAETESNKPSSPSAKNLLVRNLLVQVASFGILTVLGMWFTRYLIDHLGIENYGMIPLALSILPYASLLNFAISGTLGRFVMFHLSRGDVDQANSYFNTQFRAVLAFTIGIIPIYAIFSYYVPNMFTIPVGQEHAARQLFFIIFLSLSLTTIAGALFVSTFVKHRFDLRGCADLLNVIVRQAIVVALFWFISPTIYFFALGNIAGALANTIAAFAIFRKITPELKIRLGVFDRAKFLEMFTPGLWMALTQVGVILYLNIDPIVVNKFFGSAAVGRYYCILTQATSMRSLAAVVANILTPAMVALYAKKDIEGLMRISIRSVKFMGTVLAIPLGVLCGFSHPFLIWWLGPNFADLSPLMWIMMSHLVINLAVLPLFGITLATNRLGLPGIVTLIGGVINLGLALLFAGWGHMGMFGVAVAGMIALTAKNALFTPWYAAKVVSCSPWRFAPPLLVSILCFGLVSGTTYLLTLYIPMVTFSSLMATALSVSVVFGALVYFVLFNSEDRAFVKSLKRRPTP